jgi:hypothetical protein
LSSASGPGTRLPSIPWSAPTFFAILGPFQARLHLAEDDQSVTSSRFIGFMMLARAASDSRFIAVFLL